MSQHPSLGLLPLELLHLVVSHTGEARIICNMRLVCHACRNNMDEIPNVYAAFLESECGDLFAPSMIPNARLHFQAWHQMHMQWISNPYPDQPMSSDLSPRFLHRAEPIGEYVCIFGGRSSDGASHEVWILDSRTGSTYLVHTEEGTDCPSARSSVSLVAVKNNQDGPNNLNNNTLLVLGGLTEANVYCDELWVLRIATCHQNPKAIWQHLAEGMSALRADHWELFQ